MLVVLRAMVKNCWQTNPRDNKIVSQRDNRKHYQQQQFIVHHKKIRVLYVVPVLCSKVMTNEGTLSGIQVTFFG